MYPHRPNLNKFHKKYLDLFSSLKTRGRVQSNELSIYISCARKFSVCYIE